MPRPLRRSTDRNEEAQIAPRPAGRRRGVWLWRDVVLNSVVCPAPTSQVRLPSKRPRDRERDKVGRRVAGGAGGEVGTSWCLPLQFPCLSTKSGIQDGHDSPIHSHETTAISAARIHPAPPSPRPSMGLARMHRGRREQQLEFD